MTNNALADSLKRLAHDLALTGSVFLLTVVHFMHAEMTAAWEAHVAFKTLFSVFFLAGVVLYLIGKREVNPRPFLSLIGSLAVIVACVIVFSALKIAG